MQIEKILTTLFIALLGQVQNRLRLNWLGNRANPEDRSPFKILLGMSIFVIIWSYIFVPYFLLPSYTDPIVGLPMRGYGAIYAMNEILKFGMVVFSIYVVLKTRRHVRKRSGIPGTRCAGYEDCCCATWCGFCVITQMARHTAEYETYAAQCCSETGLPVNAPQLQFGGTEIV